MLFKAFSLNKKKDSVCFRNCTWLSRSRKISRIISRVFFFFKVLFTWKSSSREWQSSIGNQPREWQFSRSKFQLERDSKCIVKCTYRHLWGLLPSLTIIEHDHYFFFYFYLLLYICILFYFLLFCIALYLVFQFFQEIKKTEILKKEMRLKDCTFLYYQLKFWRIK